MATRVTKEGTFITKSKRVFYELTFLEEQRFVSMLQAQTRRQTGCLHLFLLPQDTLQAAV